MSNNKTKPNRKPIKKQSTKTKEYEIINSITHGRRSLVFFTRVSATFKKPGIVDKLTVLDEYSTWI